MALVGSLVPGVEMATSRGQKDVAEGVLWGLEIGAKKSLRGSRGRTQTTKKQWAQGPIWILRLAVAGRRVFAMPRLGKGKVLGRRRRDEVFWGREDGWSNWGKEIF